MKVVLSRLWSQEQGAILSAEIVLVATILVIAMIVGLAALRDSVVTELGDVAQAIANIDQSFSFGAITGHHSAVNGAVFHDTVDFCDVADLTQAQASKCIVTCTAIRPLCGIHSEGVGTP